MDDWFPHLHTQCPTWKFYNNHYWLGYLILYKLYLILECSHSLPHKNIKPTNKLKPSGGTGPFSASHGLRCLEITLAPDYIKTPLNEPAVSFSFV